MNIFVTSDTHFGHEKILSFKRPDGELLRPFPSIETMHETIVERWNSKVGAQDIVYHLGDVATCRKSLRILDRLNGKKILIKGNRDRLPWVEYSWYFYDFHGVMYHDKFILSHIPVHENSFVAGFSGNVHGHLHCHLVKDNRYFNACVERHDYAPVAWEEIRASFACGHDRASHLQHSSS